MSLTMPPDSEVGGRSSGPADDPGDHTMATSNQPLQGGSNFGDSSGPLFSIYSKAAQEEDNKMVERWQKDADGILFFTGLFSAAVAALLAVTVLDLRPNSQDTPAFYLGNIYQVLADPNATPPSTPSPVANPPPFSPPRYAVWVNTLWFLSLVMSLSCALWATSLQQWARRYIGRVQPARCSPEKRARMRAFFAEGVDKMHIPWAVEGLPMLLHLALFLFFGGLAIFLFNVNREVFTYVIGWIGLFSMAYGLITLLPIIRHNSPYHSPLSSPAWFLYAGIHYVTFKVFALVPHDSFESYRIWTRGYSRDSYQGRMLRSMEKAAEETASARSWKIDVQILDWTISALGDDNSLKSFFETIPGFFKSKLVKHRNIPEELVQKFRVALSGFLGRTWSSNSVDVSEKVCRLDILLNATNQIRHGWFILDDILSDRRREAPQSVEIGHTLARWFTNNDQGIPAAAQDIIARILVGVLEQNDSFITLAARVYGLPERDNIGLGGDNMSLATLIHVTRQYLRSNYSNGVIFEALSKFDIRNTVPRLQHDFCMLWNELLEKARDQGHYSAPVKILRGIRHPYIALHQGTDAAPTAFSASTLWYDHTLNLPSSYPFCNIASHRPHSTPYPSLSLPQPPRNSPDALSPEPTYDRNTPSRQAEQVNVIEPPPPSNPMTTSKIGAISHGPDITPPINSAHSSCRQTCASPTAAAAPQDITSIATLSHLLEGREQKDSDIVAPSAEPGTSQILFTAPTPTLAPIPASLPNTSSESYDACVASVSNSSHVAPPSIRSSLPTPRPTGSAILPRLRARGLTNTRNICFANAVLQLLVYSPPFWNLFRELGHLKGQYGAGASEAGVGATPLVDATVRFFKEFIVEKESPSMQQRSQPATGEASRVDEEKKDDNVVDSFEPTYLFDAMKGKRQLRPLLDGQQQDAEEFLCLYLDALDEELSVLLASISGRQSAEREVSWSGQTEVGSQGFMVNLVESPITRIFGGKFRSPVRTPNQPEPAPTEGWRSLHLDIQPDSVLTVEDALMRVSQSRSMLDGPSGSSDASQQRLIEALPPVLVLHLKRFRYDAAAGGVIKIGKPVQFSSELEIPFDIMVPNAQRTSEPPHYKLYGVLYHHGESAGSGHYTVDVLHPDGDSDTGEVWLHIDNETVTRMRHESVFGEHGAEWAADEHCAYLLLYCRTSPIAPS